MHKFVKFVTVAINFTALAMICTVASIPIPGGRSLRPVKNRGVSFVKVVNQNFLPIFYWAN